MNSVLLIENSFKVFSHLKREKFSFETVCSVLSHIKFPLASFVCFLRKNIVASLLFCLNPVVSILLCSSA